MWYEIMLSLSMAVAVVLAIYAFRQNSAPGAKSLGFFMSLVAVYASAQLLELLNIPALSVLAFQLRLSSIAVLAVIWVVFAYTYTHAGSDRRTLLSYIVVISLLPAFTLALIWTNQWHGGMFRAESLRTIPISPNRTILMVMESSTWYWIHAVYSYALTIVGTVLILWNATRSARLNMQRALALTSVVLLTATAILLWIFNITRLDYSSTVFMLAGAIYLWIAAGHPMMPMIPLSRSAVVASMDDAVVVLDWRQSIVDLNPSAVALFRPARSLIQQPIGVLGVDWPGLQNELTHLDLHPTVKEIERCVEDETAYFELMITPLYYQLGQFAGHSLVFRDITQRKLAKIALETANEELERRVAVRTAELQRANLKLADMAVTEERLRIAREIHDGLGHHLMGLSIQLQVATDLVPPEAVKLKTIVERCRDEVAAAIAESRRSVSSLREYPNQGGPLTDAIADLTHQFRSSLPCELRIHQRGHVIDLPPQQSHAIYRTVQEALTNIQKHAQDAAEVSITFDYNDDWRLVRIENRSGLPMHAMHTESPSSHPKLSTTIGAEDGHYGLAGLHERATQLGGKLASGTLPDGGFYIEMRLPTEETQV